MIQKTARESGGRRKQTTASFSWLLSTSFIFCWAIGYATPRLSLGLSEDRRPRIFHGICMCV